MRMLSWIRSLPWINGLIALVALGTPLTIAAFGDRAVRDHGRETIRESLSTVLDAEAASLSSWRADRLRLVEQLGARGDVRDPVAHLAAARLAPGPEDASTQAADAEAQRARLARVLAPRLDDREVRSYQVVALDGTCLASNVPEAVGQPADLGRGLDAARSPVDPAGWDRADSGQTRIWVAAGSGAFGLGAVWVATPIRPPLLPGELEVEPPIALLALRLDPKVQLHPLLGRGRHGETGESFLMTYSGTVVTPTRFRAPGPQVGAAQVPMGPDRADRLAGVALDGTPGYAGEQVVAAWQTVPDLPLLLVTEQQADEAWWGVRTARVGIWLGTGSICLLIAGLISAFALGRRRLARANATLAGLNTRLATVNTELAGLNTELERRVAERTREAVEANQAKSEFLARMSHELRTPLNGVIGLLALARDRAPEGPLWPLLGRATHAARGLLDIIGEVLDFSKIEARRLVLERTEFSLAEVIDALAVLPAAHPHGAQVALRVVVDPAVPAVLCGDPLRLRQVLFNLVGNAFKFTEQGEVVLRVTRVDAAPAESDDPTVSSAEHPMPDERAPVVLRFSVEDTGAGFDPEHIDHLFEPFAQGDESVARQHGGTGLGLAISRAFVEAMGGALRAEGAPGAGARFWFEARFTPMHGSSPGGPSPGGSGPGSHRLAATPPPAPLPPLPLEPSLELCPPKGPSRGQVLVVEDDETNRIVAHGLITRLGYAPHLAPDGPSALAACLDQRFDLVFVDIRMPGMDGYAVVRALRARHGPDLPIVMLTADIQPDALARALAAGANGHLSKPIEPPALQATLARYVRAPASERAATPTPTGACPGAAPAAPGTPTPTAPPPAASLRDRLAAVPAIDAVDVDRRLAGDLALFAALAAGFIKHHAQVAETAALAWDAGDHETALRLLHTLKGVAGNLGALSLSALASAGEARAFEHRRPDFAAIAAAVQGLVAQLRGCLAGLAAD